MVESWKTLRVVVELKVKGDYTEKDLRWDIQRSLLGFHPKRRGYAGRIVAGYPVIKEFGRVLAAIRRLTNA